MAMVNDNRSLRWGCLVKSWATGRNYIDTDASLHPPPAGPLPAKWALPALKPVNFNAAAAGAAAAVQKAIPGVLHLSTEKFTDLLNEAGIEQVNYPPGTTEVIIVQGNANTMVIRLPPTSVLQASEANLKAGGAYPMFTFYDPLYSPPGAAAARPRLPVQPDNKAVMELHANRIGDYTMGLCA